MSTNIEIKKEIEIDIQIDHISCDECGDELNYDVTTDNFGDLQIKVSPCKCILEG